MENKNSSWKRGRVLDGLPYFGFLFFFKFWDRFTILLSCPAWAETYAPPLGLPEWWDYKWPSEVPVVKVWLLVWHLRKQWDLQELGLWRSRSTEHMLWKGITGRWLLALPLSPSPALKRVVLLHCGPALLPQGAASPQTQNNGPVMNWAPKLWAKEPFSMSIVSGICYSDRKMTHIRTLSTSLMVLVQLLGEKPRVGYTGVGARELSNAQLLEQTHMCIHTCTHIRTHTSASLQLLQGWTSCKTVFYETLTTSIFKVVQLETMELRSCPSVHLILNTTLGLFLLLLS